jgi:hypothetical protein
MVAAFPSGAAAISMDAVGRTSNSGRMTTALLALVPPAK